MIGREVLSHIVFTKRLPADFQRLPLLVTPRADRRVLKPGFDGAGFDLMLVARQFVKPGHVVWDIGSNQGIFSACAAAKAGTVGSVWSVEADPTYASMQHRSFRRFPRTAAPCSVLCAAVSDQVSIADFSVSADGHARSGLAAFNQEHVASTKPVVTVTLDFLLQHWPAPNVVKIDVEGADFHVLSGAAELLRKARPAIYVEMTPETWDRSNALLRDASYEVRKLEGDGRLTVVKGFDQYTMALPS